MRILLPLDNRGGGGIARFALGLARALPSQFDTDDILIIRGSRPQALGATNGGLVAGGRLARHPLVRVAQEQLGLLRAARQTDVVHMADYRVPLLISAPFILTVHDVTFLDHPEWFPGDVAFYKRHMLHASLRKGPRAVVCVSTHTLNRLLTHHARTLRRSFVRVISSGLDAPPDVTPSAPPGCEGSGYFLTVSAIEPRKNHLGLLAAFREARSQGSRLRWKIVGAPQYRSEPILKVLRGAEGVDVLGRVPDAELEHLYRHAAFVAVPSFEEGFGYPALEAMARGVATVCSTGSALDETVGGASLQLPAGATAEWAGALLRLEQDQGLRASLVEAGLQRAKEFSWETAAHSYVELFKEVFRHERL